MNNKKVLKQRAHLSMVPVVGAILAAGAGTGALAQSAPAAPGTPSSAADSALQEVVVTGSLIRRTTTETASPVTILTSDDLAKSGVTNVSDALRGISADSSGSIPNAFSGGFAAGASGIALRGLTVNSTLVLIDGLRTANYPLADDGARGFVDLNTIPFSAVQQIEVLKDGASSIYGADAIGGVVNVITKKTFEGVEGNVELGDTQHGGGFGQRYALTAGRGDLQSDGYNAYINLEFQGDARIADDQRGFPFNTNDLSSIGGQNNIGGQPSLNSGSIYGSVAPATLANGSVLAGSPVGVTQPLRPCGAGTTQATDGSGNGYCTQNFLNYTDIQPAERRGGILGHLTVQIAPSLQGFLSVSYYENRTVADEAPAQIQSSTPINTDSIALPAILSNGQLNPNNPFASQGEAALINYAFGDIPSLIVLDNHVYRAVAGIDGNGSGWDYKLSLNFNHASLSTEGLGFIYQPQLISDIETGAYNFVNPAANTAAVLDALAPALHKTSTSDLDSLDVSGTRQLLELAGGPLSLALGGQYRYEALSNPNINTNDEVAAGDGTIQPAYAFGHRTVGGIFSELEAPLLQSLVANVAGRFDHYSDVGSAFSPKAGLKFTPVKQVVLRGTFSLGFRAPSFSESGNSGVIGYVPYIAGSTAPESFVQSHGNDAYVTAPYNLNGSTTGNPQIKPEKSDSFTTGIVLEPDEHLNVSLDYYSIHKRDVIGGPNQGAILADYYAGLPLPGGASVIADAPDPLYPNALPRPIVVNSPYVNSNSEWTNGLDLDLRAKADLPFAGRWTSELNFTQILHFNYDQDGVTFDYVGTQAPYGLSSGAGTPRYRANWSNSFSYGRVNVTGTLYYVSGYKETGVDVTGDPFACLYTSATGAPLPANCQVGHFLDFDLTGRYEVSRQLEIYATIYNLFDSRPPLDPANYAGGADGSGFNYNPTYSQAGAVGRAFRIGVHFKL